MPARPRRCASEIKERLYHCVHIRALGVGPSLPQRVDHLLVLARLNQKRIRKTFELP
jgi:hypothetical protein